jgi:hypothetical protein
MMKAKLRHLIAAIVLAVPFSMTPLLPLAIHAQQPDSIADNVCRGVLSTENGGPNPSATISACQESGNESFSFLAQRIINIFSIVVGAVSVIMIIIGGFRYIISGGDSTGVSGAKNTILYAIVGLIIVLFAQVIIRFVLTNVKPNG